jgi:transaldolase
LVVRRSGDYLPFNGRIIVKILFGSDDMKIFIDSAKLTEIEEAYSAGFLDGVTTNPSLLKAAVDDLRTRGESTDIAAYIEQILKVAKGTPVSLEVTEYSAEGMVKQAQKIYDRFNPIANNVNIKIPVNPVFEGMATEQVGPFDGLKAIKSLADVGIPINCTLIFTPEQALLAAKAGAKYVSPFAGRVDDYIRTNRDMTFKKTDYYPMDGEWREDKPYEDNGIVSGVDLVAQIVQVYKNYTFDTEVLAASIRNARQTRESALVGADIATLPLYVIRDLVSHYKTREGMDKFLKDVIPEYVEIMR